MRRTTISLPPEVSVALEREARRRGVSASAIAREALSARLGLGRAGQQRSVRFAALGRSDQDHDACRAILARAELRLVLPALVVAKATYFIGRRLGPCAESQFLRSLAAFDVEAPAPEDFDWMAELVDASSDFPLGGTHASVIALAERSGAEIVVTLDRRHLGAVKPRHRHALTLLP